MTLRDFVPPIIIKALKPLRRPHEYASYHQAVADCEGYENPDIADAVLTKTRLYRDALKNGSIHPISSSVMTFAALTVLGCSNPYIIDFGGALGAHYFEVRSLVPKTCLLHWIVVDTPEMVQRGTEFIDDELSFASDLTAARKAFNDHVDLIHSAGTLQYVPDPEAMLRTLLSQGADYVLLRRMALSKTETRITIQKHMLSWSPGPTPNGFKDRQLGVPRTALAKHIFDQAIYESGYKIIATFADESGLFYGAEREIGGALILRRI